MEFYCLSNLASMSISLILPTQKVNISAIFCTKNVSFRLEKRASYLHISWKTCTEIGQQKNVEDDFIVDKFYPTGRIFVTTCNSQNDLGLVYAILNGYGSYSLTKNPHPHLPDDCTIICTQQRPRCCQSSSGSMIQLKV